MKLIKILFIIIYVSWMTTAYNIIELKKESNMRSIESLDMVILYIENNTKNESFFEIFLQSLGKVDIEELNITVAKIHGPAHPEVLYLYQVSRFPEIVGLRHMEFFLYKSNYSEIGVHEFLDKTFIRPILKLENATYLKSIIREADYAVVGFFMKDYSSQAEAFKTTCLISENIKCYILLNDLNDNEIDHIEKIIVFNKRWNLDHTKFEAEQEVFQGNLLSVKVIQRFMHVMELPYSVDYGDFISQRLTDHPLKVHLVVWLDRTSPNYSNQRQQVHDAGRRLYGKVITIVIDPQSEQFGAESMGMLGVAWDDLPIFVFVNITTDITYRFIPGQKERSITGDNILAFYDQVMQGEIKAYFKSQDPPLISNGPGKVVILVATTYYNVTNEANVTVIVNFYSTKCNHCDELTPVWEKLAHHYADNDMVIVAQIDCDLNELEDQPVKHTPTIILYGKTDKTPIQYHGQLNIEELIEFVDKDGEQNLSSIPIPNEEL